MKDGIKELSVVVGLIFALLVVFAVSVAIMIGIPAAAIVWIIETCQG